MKIDTGQWNRYFDQHAVVAILTQDPRVEAAYLLGSAVYGAMRPDSDVDIAILPAPAVCIDDINRIELGVDLTMAAGREVDLGIISSDNLVYAREALLTGRRIYARNPAIADAHAHILLGMYFCFNEERKEVLDAYHNR